MIIRSRLIFLSVKLFVLITDNVYRAQKYVQSHLRLVISGACAAVSDVHTETSHTSLVVISVQVEIAIPTGAAAEALNVVLEDKKKMDCT